MNVNPRRKDVVIIGGGIAGLTAAMCTSMMALDAMVIQKTPFMGQIPESSRRNNYPGLRNVTGADLASNIEEQVEKDFSVEIRREEVVDIIVNSSRVPYRFLVKTGYEHYLAKCVILATGSRPKERDIGSSSSSHLHGISYFPMFDSQEFKGKKVVIIGIRDSTVQFVSWLVPIADSITIIEESESGNATPMHLHELESLAAQHKESISILWDHKVDSIEGTGHVEKITITDNRNSDAVTLPVESIIVCAERTPNSELAAKLGCDLDRKGFVLVDREQKTAIQGLFAAGDVAGVVMAAVKSAGEGCVSGLKAAEYLKTGSW